MENIIKSGQFQGIGTDDAAVLELMRRLEIAQQDLHLQIELLIAENLRLSNLLATKADKGNIGA